MLIIDNCYLPEIRTDFHFYEFEHKALNSVDLPTFGSPTIAIDKLIGVILTVVGNLT